MNRFALENIFPFLVWGRKLNKRTLRDDFFAGFTGAIIVLPQGVAFAMIAGLPPVYGLYTAMVTPIIAALFGSSYHLISGPTTAISLVVYSSVSQYVSNGHPEDFVPYAITLSLIAGIFQYAMGLVKLGTLINFVSHTVVIGFTAGAAILIATSQLKHALGIQLQRGLDFGDTIIATIQNIGLTNPYVLLISALTLTVAVVLRKISEKFPHMLIAMLFGSVLTWIIGAEANGISLIGELPKGLPAFSGHKINPDLWFKMVPDAFAIALLGLIEAVAIGRAIGIQSGQRINGNQEFIGQGLSNIFGSFFSCYPGSGSFTRSGINFQSGAKTPMSAIFASVLLMLIVLFIAPFTAYLPLPAMAGLILLVAYNLIDFGHIRSILNTGKRETTVMLITFFSTLFLDLEFAIYIGVIFSLVLYLRATSKPRLVELTPDPDFHNNKLINVERKDLKICPQVKIIRFDGSLFFGAIEHALDEIEIFTANTPKFVVFVLSGVNLIDMSGAEMLTSISKKMQLQGKVLYLGGVKRPIREYLEKGGFDKTIGLDRIFIDEEDALQAVFIEMDKSICQTCTARVFNFCPTT